MIFIKHLELALHCHTHYSLLDGFSTPQENLQACQNTGKRAYTVTEHGNQLSHIYFARLKSKFPDIKIIYGNELYECFDMNIKDKDSKYFHLIALARNENGRKALNHITTLSNLKGFYYKPRISIDKMKEYGKDLIITSACLASKLSREQDYNKCIEYINEYKNIFPYFFLELQPHNAIQQQTYNKKLLQLGKDTNTKCVLGLDVHYATKDDAKYQAYFVQMSGDREAIEEIYEGCYVQNDDEIYSCLNQYLKDDEIDELIQNTNDIITLCDDVQMPFQKPRLPHYKLPKGYNSNYEYLVELTNQGFISRGLDKKEDTKIYRERLEYELSVIKQMDFSGYFVILWDLLRYLTENGEMVGSGRGSGSGSIVNYCLHITDIDPIEYQLPFERFLNPERISYPDIDSDITNREVAVQYLMDKYGQDKVCQVLNFSYITPLVAIKDVASKIFKIPYKIAEKISKKFAYTTFEECLKHNPDIYNEYPQYKEWFNIAGRFSGKIKTTSIHAGGVGIVDGSVDDYMSLRLGKDGSHVIEVDKREVEEIGIVKYDLLGVKTINIVQETLKLAHIDNFEVNPNNTTFINNKASFETISKGNTKLIFQMESAGMTDLAMQIKPTTLGELSDIIALYRPDSMPFIPNYIEGKKDINNIKYIHPDMAEILDKTYGALIYQEQTMNIVRKFGGRTMGGADIFRKIIGKKLLDLVKPEVDKLRGEIIGNGYSQEVANSICEMLQAVGGYSFNLSHSISYAVLGLQTAYLKTHYPVEFYTACFNYTDKAKISKYLVDAKENGIEILLPNINKSQAKFSVYNNKVLFGLEMIQGLGEGEVSKILQERNANGEFKSLQDFIQRVKPSEKLIVALVKAGALPVKNKREFLQKYFNKKYNTPFIYKPVKKAPKIEILQKEWGINTDGLNEQQRTNEYNRLRAIKQSVEHQDKIKKQIENVYDKYLVDEELWEFQTLNMFVSNNPFDEIYKHITPVEDIQIGGNGVLVGVIAKVQTKKDKNKNQYAFIEVYTTDGVIEVACWHNEYKQFNEMIKKGQKISLCYSKTEGNLTVKDIMPFDKWIDYYNKELKGNKV